ncbi:MAG: hypothetical protein SGPRY_002417 [Prymnesium sp.]
MASKDGLWARLTGGEGREGWDMQKIFLQIIPFGEPVPRVAEFLGEMHRSMNLMELLAETLNNYPDVEAKVLYIDEGSTDSWTLFTDQTERTDLSCYKIVYQLLTAEQVFKPEHFIESRSGTNQIRPKAKLREHQKNMLLQIFKVLRPAHGHEKFMVIMPTGTGKTRVIALAPFMLGSEKVLVIVPGLTLVAQLKKELISTYRMCMQNSKTPNVETVTSTSWDADVDVTDIIVANVQCLVDEHKQTMRHKGEKIVSKFNPDLIIFDEGHHEEARSYKRLMEFNQNCKAVLCTATPQRGDGKRFGLTRTEGGPDRAFYRSYSRREALKEGHLKETKYHPIVFDGKKTDVKLELKYNLTGKTEINYVTGLILPAKDMLLELRRTTTVKLRMMVTVREAKVASAVADFFNKRSAEGNWKLTAKPFTGMTKDTNDTTAMEFKAVSGAIVDVVVQCKMLGEGYDNPCAACPLPISHRGMAADCCAHPTSAVVAISVFLSPPDNVAGFAQYHGRALRVLESESASTRLNEAHLYYPDVPKVQTIVEAYKNDKDMSPDSLFDKLDIEDMESAHKEFGRLSREELKQRVLTRNTWEDYHEKRREGKLGWPEDPAETIADWVCELVPAAGDVDFSVLDLGCGPDLTFENRLAKVVEQRNGGGTITVAAVDYKKVDVTDLNDAAAAVKRTTKFVCESYESCYTELMGNKSFTTAHSQYSFDAVVFCLSFWSHDALEHALLLAAKVLKPAGKVYIVQPFQRFGVPFNSDKSVTTWAKELEKEMGFSLCPPWPKRIHAFIALTLDNIQNANAWIVKKSLSDGLPKSLRKTLRKKAELGVKRKAKAPLAKSGSGPPAKKLAGPNKPAHGAVDDEGDTIAGSVADIADDNSEIDG